MDPAAQYQKTLWESLNDEEHLTHVLPGEIPQLRTDYDQECYTNMMKAVSNDPYLLTLRHPNGEIAWASLHESPLDLIRRVLGFFRASSPNDHETAFSAWWQWLHDDDRRNWEPNTFLRRLPNTFFIWQAHANFGDGENLTPAAQVFSPINLGHTLSPPLDIFYSVYAEFWSCDEHVNTFRTMNSMPDFPFEDAISEIRKARFLLLGPVLPTRALWMSTLTENLFNNKKHAVPLAMLREIHDLALEHTMIVARNLEAPIGWAEVMRIVSHITGAAFNNQQNGNNEQTQAIQQTQADNNTPDNWDQLLQEYQAAFGHELPAPARTLGYHTEFERVWRNFELDYRRVYPCPVDGCDIWFTRNRDVQRHIASRHPERLQQQQDTEMTG